MEKPIKEIIESSKQAHNAKKIESMKNRTVCSNLDLSNTSVTLKTLETLDGLGHLSINLLQK